MYILFLFIRKWSFYEKFVLFLFLIILGGVTVTGGEQSDISISSNTKAKSIIISALMFSKSDLMFFCSLFSSGFHHFCWENFCWENVIR
jgi:hypothetical protein